MSADNLFKLCKGNTGGTTVVHRMRLGGLGGRHPSGRSLLMGLLHCLSVCRRPRIWRATGSSCRRSRPGTLWPQGRHVMRCRGSPRGVAGRPGISGTEKVKGNPTERDGKCGTPGAGVKGDSPLNSGPRGPGFTTPSFQYGSLSLGVRVPPTGGFGVILLKFQALGGGWGGSELHDSVATSGLTVGREPTFRV